MMLESYVYNQQIHAINWVNHDSENWSGVRSVTFCATENDRQYNHSLVDIGWRDWD